MSRTRSKLKLDRLGVAVTLDRTGKAHFRGSRRMPPTARRLIETRGDLIEAVLIERVQTKET